MRKISTGVRVGQLDEFVSIVLRLFNEKKGDLADNYLNDRMTELSELSIKMNLAIKRDKILSNLDALDTERVNALRAFRKLVDGYCYIPLDNKKESALFLKKIYAKYRPTIIDLS